MLLLKLTGLACRHCSSRALLLQSQPALCFASFFFFTRSVGRAGKKSVADLLCSTQDRPQGRRAEQRKRRDIFQTPHSWAFRLAKTTLFCYLLLDTLSKVFGHLFLVLFRSFGKVTVCRRLPFPIFDHRCGLVLGDPLLPPSRPSFTPNVLLRGPSLSATLGRNLVRGAERVA